MAKKAGQVLGTSIVPAAIEDTKETARRNGLENTVLSLLCIFHSNRGSKRSLGNIV